MIRVLAAAVLLAVNVPISAQAAPENRSGNSTQLNPTNTPMPGWDVGFGRPHAFTHNLGYVVDPSGHYATGGSLRQASTPSSQGRSFR